MGVTNNKPGEEIRVRKQLLKNMVLAAVQEFESVTSVPIQSVHYYRTEPDTKLLSDQGKRKVDIILIL